MSVASVKPVAIHTATPDGNSLRGTAGRIAAIGQAPIEPSETSASGLA